MTNKEAFLKLVSEEDTETLKEIKERIQKRKDMTPKEEQKKLLAEIMEADAKDGLYNQECCTPEGQIKRYVDCIGCDRKPGEELKLKDMTLYGKLSMTAKGEDPSVIEYNNIFERVAEYKIHPDYYFSGGEHWDSVTFELVEGKARILKITSEERPKTGVLNLKDTAIGEIVEYALHVRSQKYEKLLIIQRRPKEAIYFKDQEISAEKLIEILENIEIPE
jgi:hypothetical protein